MMRKILFTMLALAAVLPTLSQERFVGGDISLLPSYVENGAEYYDHQGQPIADPLAFFQQQGMNAMRVRLFVDPSQAPEQEKGEGVRQDLEYVKRLGKQIKDAGMKLMLDFHYSDSWADPGKQFTPQDWVALDDGQLAERVHDYTRDVLREMKAYGAEPDFIQTGNEISYGMMWGERGAAEENLLHCWPSSPEANWENLLHCWPSSPEANWARFTRLLVQATKACREECPQAKIVLHVERVSTSQQKDNQDYAALKNFYSQMAAAQIDYDIIGLSYYPYFHGTMEELEGAIQYLEQAYPEKEIMLVEAGYCAHDAISGTFDYTYKYPISDQGQGNFTRDLIAMLKRHERVTGLFWWFMEANEHGLDWNTERVTDAWYNASLFDNHTGRATSALSLLKDFLERGSTDIAQVETPQSQNKNNHWYTLDGKRLPSEPTAKGLYIHNGNKVMR